MTTQQNTPVLLIDTPNVRVAEFSLSPGHATNIMVKADTMDWAGEKSLLDNYKVPEAERFFNQFCKQCGSCVWRIVAQAATGNWYSPRQ